MFWIVFVAQKYLSLQSHSSFWRAFFLLLFNSPSNDTDARRSKKTPASERGPKAQSGIFLSTHEPCCMCISSILWTGFQRIFYFLPYETTTAQGIPHDINTMHELWGVNSYRKQNKYFASACIQKIIEDMEESGEKKDLQEQAERLLLRYNELSQKYHKEKTDNKRNSLVLG